MENCLQSIYYVKQIKIKNKKRVLIVSPRRDILSLRHGMQLKAPSPSKIDLIPGQYKWAEIWSIYWDCSGDTVVKFSARSPDI